MKSRSEKKITEGQNELVCTRRNIGIKNIAIRMIDGGGGTGGTGPDAPSK
ncbi:MAG: hypothetical protein FWC39_01165 [Bacteroidetes bacterium]|nr:hypothetical protein [Bacteroidota bacterium]